MKLFVVLAGLFGWFSLLTSRCRPCCSRAPTITRLAATPGISPRANAAQSLANGIPAEGDGTKQAYWLIAGDKVIINTKTSSYGVTTKVDDDWQPLAIDDIVENAVMRPECVGADALTKCIKLGRPLLRSIVTIKGLTCLLHWSSTATRTRARERRRSFQGSATSAPESHTHCQPVGMRLACLPRRLQSSQPKCRL